jgi:hypothetical protein
MPRKKKSGKSKKNKKISFFYLVPVGFVILIVLMLGSSSTHAKNYDFCEKLNDSNLNAEYIELHQQLKNMCDEKELTQNEQDLGNLSLEFMSSLSIFNGTWRNNKTIAKEYAEKIDNSYITIININITDSKIPPLVKFLYKANHDDLVSKITAKSNELKYLNSTIKKLEQERRNLNDSLKNSLANEEKNKDKINNFSLIYAQKKNESRALESNLTLVKNKYEKTRSSFTDDLFFFLIIGFAIGGIIGLALCLKWKNERLYWDAYSSFAKVKSPLIFAALLTGVFLIILVLYILVSGQLEAIFASG